VTERDEDKLERFEALGDQFEAREHAEAKLEPESAHGRRAVAVGLVLLVLAGLVLAVAQLRSPSGASANPGQAAEAARRAETFSFTTRSELLDGAGQLLRATNVEGEVDLVRQALKASVTGEDRRVGFERIIFPEAVFVRQLSGRASHLWIGAELQPQANITVNAGSGGGIGDVLGLLSLLKVLHPEPHVGSATIEGMPTSVYTLKTTVGGLTRVLGQPISRSLAKIPVTVKVWQERRQRLLRAVREFSLDGSGSERVRVTTNFSGYAAPSRIVRPEVPLAGTQRLAPFANDPLGASVLGLLTAATGHTATPAGAPQTQRPPHHRAPAGVFTPARTNTAG
jgi:hypothetical protein